MKSLNVLVLLSLCCLFACNKKVTGPIETHIQVDCRILDKNFQQLKSYSGTYCAFFPNGEWISITGKVIDLHSKTNQLRVHFPQMGHHEIKLSKDEAKIFFLSTEIRDFKGKKTRFDVINISDRNGALVARWDLFEHLDELYQKLDLTPFDKMIPTESFDENFPDSKYEFSHLNAIYEIPKNNLEKSFPYMKEGNLLVTFNGLGSVVVFDPELKRIEFIYRVLKTNLLGISDGQILPNGHLLIFKNTNTSNKHLYSSINEYDLQKNSSVWNYDLNEKEFTHIPDNGAVQLLSNNNIFITESSGSMGRMLEVNRKGEVVRVQLNDMLDSRTKKPSNIYRAKKINLEKFLEFNF
ncbi:MAG: aryl-sulfate sulfotransferase [Bacteriovorax sp.]|nr:aryl-sulfate sulfotransferase [Bacteriovorax sp.]